MTTRGAGVTGKIMCRTSSLFLLALILITPFSLWCQQSSSASNDVLTLDQAIALALHENHIVRGAENAAEAAGHAVAATRTRRLPSMNVFGLAGEQFVEPAQLANPLSTILPGVGPFFSIGIPRRPTGIFAGLLLQPLSQQYRLGLTVEQAKLVRD